MKNEFEKAKFSFLFGFFLFAINFGYTFFIEQIILRPELDKVFLEILVKMIFGMSKFVYDINPWLGTYYLLFNIIYQPLWLLVTLLWLETLWPKDVDVAINYDFMYFVEKKSFIYNRLLQISLIGPLIAIGIFILFNVLATITTGISISPLEYLENVVNSIYN